MAVSKPTITLGGKGSSLSSISVYSIAHSLSLLKLDPSSLTKKPSSSNPTKFLLSIPNYLTPQEKKASIFITLNKLLTSSSSSSLFITSLIDTLNLPQETETETDLIQIKHPTDTFSIDSIVIAISALIDHNASAISSVADAVAALSCESLQADVTKGFNSIVDSGDGLSDKDRVSVANDFRVFLNGSKFVGKFQSEFVSAIPIVHARLRNVVRTVRSATRVELNSRGETDSRDVFTVVLPVAVALWNLGELSWGRAKLNIDALLDGELKSSLLGLFNEGCPSVGEMERLVKCSQEGYYEKDYVRSLHEVYGLTEVVRRVVSWEAMSAFMLLEGAEWIEKVRADVPIMVDGSVENAKGEKKKDKKKKVIGKGTSVLMQFVKDKLQLERVEGDDSLVLLEKWVNGFSSLLDPKDSGFEGLLKKLKEIVDSNESRRLPKLPKGTRDFAKEQMAVREKAFSIITGVFKKHGAMALDTPVFEMRETLMGKYGEDSKLIYDLSDQGGELCSLRYDLTVPFARYVAMNGLTSFKRYQVAKVYRRDNPSKGRYREFYQCDFDIAGQYEKMGPDSEVIYILTELLDKLNIGDYEVKLNHRKLLDGMLDICGVPPEKFRTICSSIDKLDKQSFEQIKKEMVEEKGLNVETADKIGTFVKHRGRPLELLSELKQEGSKFLENSTSLSALNELEILFNALENAGRTDKLVLDLSLARGLDYYTGVIFEAVFKGETQVGSIAAGGRYDNLIGMFGTKQVPAIGVSLGIERVFTIMEQLQKDQNQAIRATETEILVSVIGDDLSLALKLASKCWDAELKAEYMVNKRVMKHIDRAKDFKIPYMVIVGERELSEGIVKLKDVNANKEETVPISKFVDELLARLRA